MPKKKRKKLTGVCLYFIEQGSNGQWAFQDSNYIFPPESMFPFGRWEMDGLHILKNGDELTIFSPDDIKKIVWSGTIELIKDERRLPRKDKIVGSWYYQKGVKRDVWPIWFDKEYPAELIPAR